MGFRTLAIQKRSSEVWNLLAAVKTEWTKYGDLLDAVQKKINQASETIDQVKVRSRAIGESSKTCKNCQRVKRALLCSNRLSMNTVKKTMV
jgi:DNA recombination protein RmuC